jgi:hypothetical protein
LGIEMKCLAASTVVMLLAGQAGLSTAAGPSAGIKALREVKREVNWDAKSAVVADVTCDGVPDTVVVGYERDAVWIGTVPGTRSNKPAELTTTRFSIGKQTQDSFCGVPVRVEAYPIECEDEEVGALPGCKRVKGCSAFSLVDDACDSFHFYWDSSQKALTWWRR